MTTQITHPVHEEGGNTNLPPPPFKSRKWCFTLNNYSDEIYAHIHSIFVAKKWLYIIGKEVGKSGTPHLQGFIESKNAILFTTLKKIMPTAHLEAAKGSTEQNRKYCSKDGDFVTNIEAPDGRTFREKLFDLVLQQEYGDVQWKDWQKDVIDVIDGPVDGRAVHWLWEETGNVGKSYLAKYLAMRDGTIICDGKKDNIFNQVNAMLDKEIIPKVILLDIPRSVVDSINYTAIELLQNGCIYSGKYEGGLCIFPRPHVICFANVEPNTFAMSHDRWKVKKIC